MILLTDVSHIDYNCDYIFAIVRSAGSLANNSKVTVVPCLSPDRRLFYDYLNWKREGKWGKDCFETQYKPRFLSQISNDREARNWLNYIWKLDKEGKTIALVCFCKDETICHRSIVGGLLLNAGANVKCNTNYKCSLPKK